MADNGSLWWVGLLLDCVAALAGAIGKQLLRHAAVSRNRWFIPLGLCFTAIIDPAFDLLAYSFAAQSIIAAAAGLGIVWNVLLAPCTLGERLTRSRITGAGLICVGTVCIGVFASHVEVERTPDAYLTLFLRPAALAYYAAFVVWTVLCLAFYYCASPTVGAFFLCALGGSLAGNSFTTKAAVELTECGVESAGCGGISSPFESPLFYVFAATSLTTASLSLALLVVSLRGFEALYMITVYQGFFILAGAVSGNLVMDEKAGRSTQGLSLYTLSVAVVIVGLYVLTRGELDAQAARLASAGASDETVSRPAGGFGAAARRRAANSLV